jgi:biopolymer transport protein ExbB
MSRTTRRLAVVGVALWLGAIGTVTVLKAQEAPKPAPAAPARPAPTAAVEEPAPQETTMTLWGLWVVGGWCMWPLGATNVAALAFSVIGFMIVKDDKMLVPTLIPSLQEAIDNLRIEDAMNICSQTPSLTTNVLHAGLQRISDGVLDVGSMEKAMEEATVEETQGGLRMINYISINAQIAPMLGLLGTVSGMIKAFDKIGKGAMGKPELLAGDIGEALITTAYGLIVGIPAMIFYFYLKSRYTANISKMGRILGNLSHRLVAATRRTEGGAAPASAGEPAGEPAAASAQ